MREEIARRVRDAETDSRDARFTARQVQEALHEAQAKLAQLEIKLAESRDRQLALESLYQDLSRNRDEWVLAEIEQILTLASQQLQLAGNARAALTVLQTADARLARTRNPQFLPLRKVFARDMERLKAAPGPDLVDSALKLDQLAASVDSLPLAQDARPGAASRIDSARGQEGFWERLLSGLIRELKQLIRIENTDRADPVLLNPSQVFFLRENLKLRLLNARLALLARDDATYRSDLKAAAGWLERYFDTRSRETSAAIGSLNRLGAGSASVSLPSIAESLAAVRSYKAPQQRREP